MPRLILCAALLSAAAQAQQIPDRDYLPAVTQPLHAVGTGPAVCVDEAHANFHTLGERLFAFGALLRRDGYRVTANKLAFGAAALQPCRVLVISNARVSGDASSAFTADEIAAVHTWVEDGGALLLIADHMPFGGAAARLAAAFDVEFSNGFAMREAVNRVRTFTGQPFRAPRAEALLVMPPDFIGLMPKEPWKFEADTPRFPVKGWLRGAVQKEGAGRAAFFGEAAMLDGTL